MFVEGAWEGLGHRGSEKNHGSCATKQGKGGLTETMAGCLIHQTAKAHEKYENLSGTITCPMNTIYSILFPDFLRKQHKHI